MCVCVCARAHAHTGHSSIPLRTSVERFCKVVSDFLRRCAGVYVVVHCTHGLNRTGFMVRERESARAREREKARERERQIDRQRKRKRGIEGCIAPAGLNFFSVFSVSNR